MKKILALVFSYGFVFSISAEADVFKCISDSIDAQYSMAQQTLTVSYSDTQAKVTIQNVSFQIRAPGIFDLIDSENIVLETLTLNNQGSDGASDRVFPYSAQWSKAGMAKLKIDAENAYSGCSSNYLAVKGQ